MKYLELKKVPIEDANLDKSLAKGIIFGSHNTPRSRPLKVPNEQHQSHFYTDYQAKARAQYCEGSCWFIIFCD